MTVMSQVGLLWTDVPVWIFKGFECSCLAGVPVAVLLDNGLLIKQELKLRLIAPLSMARQSDRLSPQGGTGRGRLQVNR